jgi:hypothetical protein
VERIFFLVVALCVTIPLGLIILVSIFGDVSMLWNNAGILGLAIFAAPTLAMLVWSHWHPDGR